MSGSSQAVTALVLRVKNILDLLEVRIDLLQKGKVCFVRGGLDVRVQLNPDFDGFAQSSLQVEQSVDVGPLGNWNEKILLHFLVSVIKRLPCLGVCLAEPEWVLELGLHRSLATSFPKTNVLVQTAGLGLPGSEKTVEAWNRVGVTWGHFGRKVFQ